MPIRKPNPIPLAHLDKKELEIVIAAGAARSGEISETAFEIAYGLRPDHAERDLIRTANDRVNAAYINVTDGEHLTDDGNSRRFARQHGTIIRYCHQRDQWLVWTGRQRDQSLTAKELGRLRQKAVRFPTDRA